MSSECDQLSAVLEARPDGALLICAIDGPSGCGKTTLAAALAQRHAAQVIEMDAFYIGGAELRRDPPRDRIDQCIDRAAVTDVLKTLRAGRRAEFFAFDWSSLTPGTLPTPTVIEPSGLILLEGVYSAHPDLRAWVDLTCLLSVDPTERQRRLIAREGALSAWERQWHAAEEVYFADIAPSDTFDLVLRAAP